MWEIFVDPKVSGRLTQTATFRPQAGMSALPRKQTFAVRKRMSALGQKQTFAVH